MTFLIPLAIAANGCQEKFIELSDPTRINSADYITNAESLKGAVTASYSTLRPIYNGEPNGIQLFGDVVSDNSTTQIGGPGNHVIDRFIFDPSHASFGAFWNASYKAIAECNMVLNRASGVDMDALLKNRYIAEVKFIRALTYFNLVRIFGDVPLVTKELTNYKESYDYGRAPVSEVYGQITKDLTEAAAALPDSYTGVDLGRATSGAAKAMLGKVYLTQGKFAEASTILGEVISSGKYALEPDFNNIFNTSNESNPEIIFSVRYMRGGLGLGSGFGGSMLPANSGTTILKTGATNGSYNSEMPEWETLYTEKDKRKDISVGYYAPGAPTAFYSSKFIDQAATTPTDAENDWIVVRYADVLLMRAEALNELNKTAEAEPLINMVRQRAGLANLTGLTQENFRLAMEQERRLELSMEGHRWFDLVRTGRALAVMNAHFTANAAFYGTTYSLKSHQLLFPVPLAQIQTNPILTQNPGY